MHSELWGGENLSANVPTEENSLASLPKALVPKPMTTATAITHGIAFGRQQSDCFTGTQPTLGRAE